MPRGGDHGVPKRGSGGGARSQRGPGALVRGQRAKPPEAESFLYIFIQKKWPKVQDLSEN